METGLRDRTVIVTGATANIGRGIAVAFAEEGARIVVVGRDAAQGVRACRDLDERGATATSWQAADVTQRSEVLRVVDATLERFGSIDVLVNNVGGNVDVSPFVSSDPETWERDIALNIMGTLNCTHAVLPGMIENRRGRIVNIGSTAALVGDLNLAVYSAMKGAVHSFTKVLAREVGPFGITVNAVAPYGTIPNDPDRELSTGSRFRADGLFARVAVEKLERASSRRQRGTTPRWSEVNQAGSG